MTVGQVIALLSKYASDENELLMKMNIYSIDVDNENFITVYTVDNNTPNITIFKKEE